MAAMTSNHITQSTAAELTQLSVVVLCEQLQTQIQQAYGEQLPVLVGIHRGGFYLAEWLHQALGATEPVGALDISWHRDDLRASSVSPHVVPSRI